MADLSSILAGTDEFQTPEEVERRRRQGTSLFNQGTSVAPLQHWTQALARGVQGGLGGYEIGQARDQEARGKSAANSALIEAMTGNKSPNEIAATALQNPWSQDFGQKIAGSVIQSNSPDAKLDREIKEQNLAVLKRKDNPTFGDIGVDAYGQQRKGWIDPVAQTVKPAETNDAPSQLTGSALPNGEEFLKTLPKPIADQVKGISEGRIAFPSGFALKSPYWQRMVTLVSQYDPAFDAVNYNARNKTRADFTAGKSAQNITAFNTAIQHLDTLDKSIKDLNNSGYPIWNKIANAASYNTDPKFAASLKGFETARTAVADELTRAFRGAGGNVHDIVQWEKNINSADSPQALHAAVQQAIDLLNGRIEAVADQYNRGMGTTKTPMELLSPKAQEAVARMRGKEVERLPTEAAPQQQDGPRADLRSLPPEAQRGAIVELAKDMSPQNQENFRKVFGDQALQQALAAIAQRRSAGGPR